MDFSFWEGVIGFVGLVAYCWTGVMVCRYFFLKDLEVNSPRYREKRRREEKKKRDA